jgi:predicted DNA-binding transcriptional regulator YafY
MANTSSRTLRLLSLLQTHRYWSGEELAERMSISVRTLRRDIDRLRELGYPVHADRGIGGGYQLAPGASLPPLVIDDEEAVAVVVGLMAAAQSSIAGTAEASVQALAKVIQVMPGRLRRRVEALHEATVSATWAAAEQAADPQALVLIAQACRDDERITFGYVAADRSPTRRRVEPHRLVSLGRRWYLVGYDLDRGDWRSFRLDRIADAAATGARFRQRDLPGGDAVAFVQQGIRGRTGIRVTATLAADAESVRQRIGRWTEVAAIDAATCRVELDAESIDWAVFAVGVARAPVLMAEPQEFVDELAAWSTRLGGTSEGGEPTRECRLPNEAGRR